MGNPHLRLVAPTILNRTLYYFVRVTARLTAPFSRYAKPRILKLPAPKPRHAEVLCGVYGQGAPSAGILTHSS